jgi:hypothetical protein
MLELLRRFVGYKTPETESIPVPRRGMEDGVPLPPPIHRYSSIEDWLKDWVVFHMTKTWPSGFGPCTKVPTGDALLLCGSIGYDAAISPDGTVWMNDYGWDDKENWRYATASERISFLVMAQARIYPELIVLLPLRPTDAVECPECQGFAGTHEILCATCGALGWIQKPAGD